jgi:hypothetical protein
VRPFPKNCISKTLQNGYVDSLIHGLELGKKLVMHQTLRVQESGRPACVWIIVDGRAAILKSGIPLKCLGPTQRCFSECLLWHFVRFCGRLTKFLAEVDANTFLLEHIHFAIRRRDKHNCTVDQLPHDRVKLPSAPLVCDVRRCCQLSYMVVTSILFVIFQKIFVPDIFIRPRICPVFFLFRLAILFRFDY